MANEELLRVENLAGGYGGQMLFSQLRFRVNEGEFLGILGKNGSGKSTLLRLLAGLKKPMQGEISLMGRRLKSLTRKELGRLIAFLPQETYLPFHFTVEEVLWMGRYPHRSGLFPGISFRDREVFDEVVHFLHLENLLKRSILTLSGGQRQRVMVGRLFMQEPRLILLDEPMNHLDLHYQMEILTLLNQWRTEKRAAIIGVLHDLNVTSLFSDQVLLLDSNRRYMIGPTAEMMKKERLEQLYEISLASLPHPEGGKAQFLLIPPHSGRNERD